jgi:hypothetical protein
MAFLLSFKIAVPTALKDDSISWHRTTSYANVKDGRREKLTKDKIKF